MSDPQPYRNGNGVGVKVPDLIRLVIQIGGLLIAVGILYQSVKETRETVKHLADQQQVLTRDMQEWRLRSETGMADINARLRAIEERVKEMR